MQSEAPRFDRVKAIFFSLQSVYCVERRRKEGIGARNAIDNNGRCSIQLNLYGRVSSTRPPKVDYVGLCSEGSNSDGKEHKDKEQTSTGANGQSTANVVETNNKIIDKITQIISPALRKYQIHEQSKIDQTIVFRLFFFFFFFFVIVHTKLFYVCLVGITLNEGNYDPLISERYALVNSISSMMAIGAALYLRKPLYSYFYQEISSSSPSTPLTGVLFRTQCPHNTHTHIHK
ncbi:hypothetical protein RFI_02053 [Reticulomyxa filosa]|uniref:Uncharacterized protein n=1 Tax=Reticulomyxa filosa TaxID=46433 RepID=X6PBH0_RETFI|nr:hypothetical protein RFI_02053 [Reticulomyxa filosa]|eukprot:ETO35022.1 hypothetical protein RFI_02053 [Reticulomyxa filosa]